MENREKNTAFPDEHAIDLGCGPNKVVGAYGVDQYPYKCVDQVVDLDSPPWPLQSRIYNRIYARHVIEHVADVKSFMNEVHRIGCDCAIVEIITPHFSSIDSWKDPTHRWHFSSTWYTAFTEHYMAGQILPFEHVFTQITFGKNIRSLIPQLMIKFKGHEWWEKNYAFIYQARNIITRLRICKNR